jgi:hypothetical protein
VQLAGGRRDVESVLDDRGEVAKLVEFHGAFLAAII